MIRMTLWAAAGLLSLAPSLASAQDRNHEPFNLMVCNHTNKSVALVNSAIGYVMARDFIPFSAYGINGVPNDAINVWRQIWVSDIANHKIYRFSADINYPPPFYGEVLSGPLDQIRGMEYVKQNFTVYVCHSGTNFSAPGDKILMFDVTGQPIGSFPAVNPMDVLYSPALNELLVSNGTDDSIDRYSLAGAYLGKLLDSDGISGIDRPMQMGLNHHDGELLVAGADAPAGLYRYSPAGDEEAFYPQDVGHPAGIAELDNDTQHGLYLFTTENGLYTYWTDNDDFRVISDGESWGYANKVQFFCWADYDRSDFVDTDDFTAYVLDFEEGVPQADFDGSGFVDTEDYGYFIQRFIEGC